MTVVRAGANQRSEPIDLIPSAIRKLFERWRLKRAALGE